VFSPGANPQYRSQARGHREENRVGLPTLVSEAWGSGRRDRVELDAAISALGLT
jgi:hypothetical protein